MKTLSIKSIVVLTFVLIFSVALHAQQNEHKLYVKVFTKDCLTCYAGFMYVEKLAKDIDVLLVLPTMEKRKAEYFIKNNLNAQNNTLPYVLSDSLYKALEREIYSEVILKEKGIEIKRWLLKDFDGKLPDSYMPVALTTLPDSVLMDYTMIGLSDNYITLTDPMYSFISVIEKKNMRTVAVFDKTSLDALPIIHKNYPSAESLYLEIKNSLKRTNTDRVRLGYLNKIEGYRCFIPAQVYVPIQEENTDDIKIVPHPYLCEFDNLTNSLNFIELKQNATSDFYVYSQIVYSAPNNKVIIDVERKQAPYYFLAQFTVAGDSLTFDKYYPFVFPAIYAEKLEGLSINKIIAYPYVLTAWSNELWNIETEKTDYLPFKQEKLSFDRAVKKFEHDYQIVDAVVCANKTLRILLDVNNDYIVSDINLTDMTLIRQQKVSLPQKKQSGVCFLDENNLLYVADNSVMGVKLN